MTNEEIIQSVRSKYVTEGQVTMYTTEQIDFMLNMLRDELSAVKHPEGVEVYLSRTGGDWGVTVLSADKPTAEIVNGTTYYKDFGNVVWTLEQACGELPFNVSKGECAKFKIVRVE